MSRPTYRFLPIMDYRRRYTCRRISGGVIILALKTIKYSWIYAKRKIYYRIRRIPE